MNTPACFAGCGGGEPHSNKDEDEDEEEEEGEEVTEFQQHPVKIGVGLKERLTCVIREYVPHGGLRTFHQKSTCLTQLTLGPYVVKKRLICVFRESQSRMFVFEAHRLWYHSA